MSQGYLFQLIEDVVLYFHIWIFKSWVVDDADFLIDVAFLEILEARIIICKKLTYVWDDGTGIFKKLAGLDKGLLKSELLNFKWQTSEEQYLK